MENNFFDCSLGHKPPNYATNNRWISVWLFNKTDDRGLLMVLDHVCADNARLKTLVQRRSVPNKGAKEAHSKYKLS